jgi:segregation and condensation protein B
MTLNGPDLTIHAQAVDDENLQAALEAILMVAESPVPLVSLAGALDRPLNEIRAAIAALAADYAGETEGSVKRGFELREIGGGWRIYVREEYDWAVNMFVAAENPTKLSQAALETLAVIAYKQPISRGQVASIRAVNVDSVVRTLLSRGLITELFTDSETGAINYGTTELTLQLLGINSLDELPLISPYLPSANSEFDVEF